MAVRPDTGVVAILRSGSQGFMARRPNIPHLPDSCACSLLGAGFEYQSGSGAWALCICATHFYVILKF